MQNGTDGNREEAKVEMGDLVESDPELYEGDVDASPKKAARYNRDLGAAPRFSHVLDKLYDDRSEGSLVDEAEQKARVNSQKARETKLNNSFTGPYPQDPIDFNHNDKGPNA
jgi:hypothetical protein